MDVVKRLTVKAASAHEIDDPAGESPPLTNGACGIAGTERPAHLVAMAVVDTALHNTQVPMVTELGRDLQGYYMSSDCERQ
jgi:hypothetical protein